MADFKVGDTVRLKSGGPLMTVAIVPDEYVGNCACTWFDGNKEIKGSYPGDALEKDGPPRTGPVEVIRG